MFNNESNMCIAVLAFCDFIYISAASCENMPSGRVRAEEQGRIHRIA